MTFLEMIENIDVWKGWLDRYQYYVPRFIEEAKTGKNWDEWAIGDSIDDDIFHQFIKQGSKKDKHPITELERPNAYFTPEELNKIKANWNELAPLLQSLANNQAEPNYDLYAKIFESIKKYTDGNKFALTRRLITALQPRLLTTVVSSDMMRKLYLFLYNNFPELNLPKYDPKSWYKNSYQVTKAIRRYFPNQSSDDEIHQYPYIVYPYQIYNEISRLNAILQSSGNSADMNNLLTLLKSNHQIILQGPPGTGKTHLAKEIAKTIIANSNGGDVDLAKSEQYKLVQFHPSYTYEDFVRGIVVKTNDNQIEYVTENKILGEFAERAQKNWELAQNDQTELEQLFTWKQKIEGFIDYIQERIDQKGKVPLTDNVYLFEVTEKGFKYRGDNWVAHEKGLNFNFTELKKLIDNNIQKRTDIKKSNATGSLTKSHATYALAILNLYYKYIEHTSLPPIEQDDINVSEKKYILIIDEINRANLASVLGELIYALEYRGEPVESIYAIDGDHQLILPKNLYIIGTMNTADRSVGYIDYAIRRRFAFYEMLPKPLENESLTGNQKFHSELFIKVSNLFIANYSLEMKEEDFKNADTLNSEFNYRDVWLGHSYFIYDKERPIEMRLEYEIKPILHEYINDGILTEKARKDINQLSVDD